MKTILRIPLCGLDFISGFDLKINFFNLKSLPLLVLTAIRYGVSLDKLNSVLICKHCDTNIIKQSRKRKIFISDLNFLSKKTDFKRVIANCENFGFSKNIEDLLDFKFDTYEFFVGEGECQFSYIKTEEICFKDKICKNIDFDSNDNSSFGKIKNKRSKYDFRIHFEGMTKSKILSGYCDKALLVDEDEVRNQILDDEYIIKVEKEHLNRELSKMVEEKSNLPPEKKIIFDNPNLGRDIRTAEEKRELNEYLEMTKFEPKSRRYEHKLGEKILRMWPTIKDEVKEIKDYAEKHNRYPNDLIDCKLPKDFLDYPEFYVNNYNTLQEDYDNLKRIEEFKSGYEVKNISYKRVLTSESKHLMLKNEIENFKKEISELDKREVNLNNKKGVFKCLDKRRLYVAEKNGLEEVKKQIKYIELEKRKKGKRLRLSSFPEVRIEEKFPLSKNPFQPIAPPENYSEESDDEFEVDPIGLKEILSEGSSSVKDIILEDYNKAYNVLVQVQNPESIFTNTKMLQENMKLISVGKKTCGENKIPKTRGRYYFTLLAKFYSLLRNKKFVKNIDKNLHKVRGCSIKYAMKSLISVGEQVDMNLLTNISSSRYLNS